MRTRTCKRCGLVKELETNFNKDSLIEGKSYRRKCKACCSDEDRSRYQRNKLKPAGPKHKLEDTKAYVRLLAWPPP
jgi:hypothetical protein